MGLIVKIWAHEIKMKMHHVIMIFFFSFTVTITDINAAPKNKDYYNSFFRKEKIMNDLNFITHDPETIDVYGKRKKYYEYENYHDNYNENGKNVKFPIIGDVNIRLGNGDDRHDHQTGSYIAPYGEAYSIDTNHMFDR